MSSNTTSPISSEEWSVHIARWRTSGLTRSEYCEQHGLLLNSFIYQVKRCQDSQAKKLTLVPVKVNAAPRDGDVVLRSPKGWSLTLASDISAVWLGDLLERLS
jgi:hypothetical protein